MSSKQGKQSPNDQRADTKNPNNPAHKADQDNRSRQLDPKDERNQPPAPAPADPGKKA